MQPAESMRVRTELMKAIAAKVKANGWSQADAVEKLDITQAQISWIINTRIEKIALNTLVKIATKADLEVQFNITDAIA
jgi:predicted XRE-type DNA-binding protein